MDNRTFHIKNAEMGEKKCYDLTRALNLYFCVFKLSREIIIGNSCFQQDSLDSKVFNN